MALPIVAKLARELAKFTKNKSKSKLSDKLDASTETIQMGEDVFTRHEPKTKPKSTMTPEQFEKAFNDAMAKKRDEKLKQIKDDTQKYIGGDGNFDEERFNITIKDSDRNGIPLTEAQERTKAHVSKSIQGNTINGHYERTQKVPAGTNLKLGDIIESQHVNFFGKGPGSSHDYLDRFQKDPSNLQHTFVVKGEHKDAMGLENFKKPGQAIFDKNKYYSVEDIKDTFGVSDREKSYGMKGTPIKEVLLKEMSKDEFSKLPSNKKAAVIKNILSTMGIGIGLNELSNQTQGEQ